VSRMGDVRSAVVILMTMQVTISSDARLYSVEGTYLAAGSSMISECPSHCVVSHSQKLSSCMGDVRNPNKILVRKQEERDFSFTDFTHLFIYFIVYVMMPYELNKLHALRRG